MHLNVSIKNVTCIQEPHKRFIALNERGETVVIIKDKKKTDYYFVDTISHDPEQMDVFQKSNFLEKKNGRSAGVYYGTTAAKLYQ